MRSVKGSLSGGIQAEAMARGRSFLKHYTHSNIQLTKHALCESTLSGWLQAEAMGFKRSFSKHYTHLNIQLSKVCAL